MKVLAVVWTAYSCAGGASCGKIIPPAVQPYICHASPTLELYDPARARQARARVAALGAPAALIPCHGIVCGAPLSMWSTNVSFREDPTP
jgi:hypothetical protein